MNFYSRFRIHGKVTYRSRIRYFGANGGVFVRVLCDQKGEVKTVAFNDDVDRIHHLMNLN